MSLNLSFLGTHRREKHAAESVQFGAPMAIFKSFDQCCLPYYLKSFGGTIRQVQGFSLECQKIW